MQCNAFYSVFNSGCKVHLLIKIQRKKGLFWFEGAEERRSMGLDDYPTGRQNWHSRVRSSACCSRGTAHKHIYFPLFGSVHTNATVRDCTNSNYYNFRQTRLNAQLITSPIWCKYCVLLKGENEQKSLVHIKTAQLFALVFKPLPKLQNEEPGVGFQMHDIPHFPIFSTLYPWGCSH